MNAEGQHERERIGQAKCQRGGGPEGKTPATVLVAGGNSITEDGTSSSRLVVDTRKIKKERNFTDTASENGGNVGVINLVTGNNDVAPGTSENGHQHSRSNSVCRNISNGFNSGDILHDIIAAKLGQTSGIHGNTSKNDKIRIMIEDSLTEDSKNRVQEIYLKVEQLKHEEKLLLYLRMPASLTNAGGTVDPLRQPLNPLGNRYEIHQTIMWIKTHLEEDPDVSLPKQEVYDEYNMFCIRNSMKPLSTADFGKVMKQVYPRVRPRRLGTRGNSRYCYAGMRKRVKLDTPTLPAVTDTSMPDDFDEPITEEMLGAASTLIREWAESLLKMKFQTLTALARHLVDNLRVDTRSLAAVCILCGSTDGQPSSNNKETSPSLSVTPVAGKTVKLREAQLQLQRKLQQREHIRDQKHRNEDATSEISIKDKPINQESVPPSTTIVRSSSATKAWKKSKTSQSPQHSGATTPTTSAKSTSQLVVGTTTPITVTARNRKLPRSSSQTSAAISPQLNNSHNNGTKLNDEIVNNTRLSRSCTPSEVKLPVKNLRKRASLELNNQLSESSPEKQAKILTEIVGTINVEDSKNKEGSTKIEQTVLQRAQKNITVLVPSSVKIGLKIETSEISPIKRVETSKKCEKSEIAHDKPSNGRLIVNDTVSSINRLEDKLCTIDPDALDDYLNGGNNSQEQEEELLQYFQQSSSSSSDAEVTTNPLSNTEPDQVSRSDKVSQLRLILQQNLKSGTVRSGSLMDSVDGLVTTTNVRRETPISETKGPSNSIKQHDIILPIMLNHNATQTSGGTRRRVSFETSVVDQHNNSSNNNNNNNTMTGGSNSTVNTVPQSPNTRRRIFNFTPISPGPHSPINGRAASASKPNSANASPFVSPRNTPVPRSRSNLQGGISRSRVNHKSLARSISCSVPYTARNETFVVPTSNADNSRVISVSSQSIFNCRKSTGVQEVQVGGGNNLIDNSQIIGNNNDSHDDEKVIDGPCTASFIAGGDLNPQKQLFINYPSQENLQEIKNVYGGGVGCVNNSINSQPADQEISELFNGAVKQALSLTSEQIFYRSQSVPLHRMVNPSLMSPIGQHHQPYIGSFNGQTLNNNSSNSSIAPTPVPSEFNDFGSITATDAYLLDQVHSGFIPDEQQFLMEDKESITKILNILDEEGRKNLNIISDDGTENDPEGLINTATLSISMLDPSETIMDPAVVLDPSVGVNNRKITIESRSYSNNTPLPTGVNNVIAFVPANPSFNEDNSDGSTSYPSTPLHGLQPDVYRETNEPMLSSPTLNSLNLRNENSETVVPQNLCRNVTDLLETNFLGDADGNSDDLGTLANFDGLQDVDSLAPLFNDVPDNNR